MLASLQEPKMVESFLEVEVTMIFTSSPTRYGERPITVEMDKLTSSFFRVKNCGSRAGVERSAILTKELLPLHQNFPFSRGLEIVSVLVEFTSLDTFLHILQRSMSSTL